MCVAKMTFVKAIINVPRLIHVSRKRSAPAPHVKQSRKTLHQWLGHYRVIAFITEGSERDLYAHHKVCYQSIIAERRLVAG
jgi:hypothetical protein